MNHLALGGGGYPDLIGPTTKKIRFLNDSSLSGLIQDKTLGSILFIYLANKH